MNKFILSSRKTKIDAFKSSVELNGFELYYSGSITDLRNSKGQGYVLLGDCINPELPQWESLTSDNEPKGNYYLFHVSRDEIYVKSSGFGMLPVFYHQTEKMVASNVQLIADQCQTEPKFDRKWLVNQLLFNYQFGDATVYQQIKLLPAFTILTLGKTDLQLNKVLHIHKYFTSKPAKWKKHLEPLCRKFINISQQYFPDEEFFISFTGGFDGRTLVSVAKSLDEIFNTFSYGRKDNDDVVFPKRNARSLGVPYQWIPLEKEYVRKYYYPSAISFINETNGGNGFLYAHVSYAAKKIAKQTKFMISGVGGSELFRALHISGAVTSPSLIQLFKSNSFEEFRDHVHNSSVFKYLDLKLFESVIDEVATECWRYKSELPKHLTRNQQLYVFVFEEIFRKFFGSWLLAQSEDLIVRTPFLDFEFFKELLKTDLAGVYSEFMTENPLKRYKGQVFYSEIIRLTNRQLYWIKTGKGYPPSFVRRSMLRPLLIFPFTMKRIKRKITPPKLDNLSIISGIKNNFRNNVDWYIEGLNNENFAQDLEILTSQTKESRRDVLLMMASIIEYVNLLNITNE